MPLKLIQNDVVLFQTKESHAETLRCEPISIMHPLILKGGDVHSRFRSILILNNGRRIVHEYETYIYYVVGVRIYEGKFIPRTKLFWLKKIV